MSNYRNIVISGLPGAGSTTLMRLLREKLKWTGYSGGEFMLAYARENGYYDPKEAMHHDATVYPDDFDRQVDYGVRKKLAEQKEHIFEAWLAGFLAQGIEGVLKVLIVCSENAIRIDRVVNRDKVTVDEAKGHIFERERRNLEKWRRMYGKEWKEWVVDRGIMADNEPIDFWNPKLYDLVIDTYSCSREETLNRVLSALGN